MLLERDIPKYMKNTGVPGMSAALIHNGKLVWCKGFGVNNSVNAMNLPAWAKNRNAVKNLLKNLPDY